MPKEGKARVLTEYKFNGAGVIKKRVANKWRGKSGSVRTIVAFKSGTLISQ